MKLVAVALACVALFSLIRALARLASEAGSGRFGGYRALAEHFGGQYESRGLTRPPTVCFRTRDASARVGLAANPPDREGPPRMRFVARFDHAMPLRLELQSAAGRAPAQLPRGTRIVRTGDAGFDRDYIARANDPEMAIAALSTSSRQSIEALAGLGGPDGLIISLSHERLLVQVDRDLGARFELLRALVDRSLILLTGVQAAAASRVGQGVAFVVEHDDSGEPSIEALSPHCKVCGVAIEPETPTVVCEACGTPHHRDCWEFVGGCSVYGCKGREAEGR